MSLYRLDLGQSTNSTYNHLKPFGNTIFLQMDSCLAPRFAEICRNIIVRKMKTEITAILDTRRSKDDGTFPIKLRVYHRYDDRPIGRLNLYSEEDHWVSDPGMVSKEHPDARNVNAKINEFLTRAEAYKDALGSNRLDTMSCLQLKEQIEKHLRSGNKEVDEDSLPPVDPNNPQKNEYTFSQFQKRIIKYYRDKRQEPSAQQMMNDFRTLYHFLEDAETVRKFPAGRDILLRDINYEFLSDFANYCDRRGVDEAGIYHYLKSLRQLFNKAYDLEALDEKYKPFKRYELSKPKSKRKRNETLAARREAENRKAYFDSIREVQVPRDTEIWHHKNYVMFMWSVFGMNFMDVAFLRSVDIDLERKEVLYVRHKTKKTYYLPLSDEAAAILQKYLDNSSPKHGLLFPIFDDDHVEMERTDPKKFYEVHKQRMKIANFYLYVLCQLAGVPKLNVYDIRRIWGDTGKQLRIPNQIIKECYGHSSEETTEDYQRDYAMSVLRDANDRIMSNGMVNESAERQPGETNGTSQVALQLSKTQSDSVAVSRKLTNDVTSALFKQSITVVNGTTREIVPEDILLQIIPILIAEDRMTRANLIMEFLKTTHSKDGKQAAEVVDAFLSN